MKVIVCIKQIPEPTSTGQLDPQTHRLRRDGEAVLDPGDTFGIEAGLQLADASGGEVVVVCMAPERGTDAIRRALAIGAGKGILIADPALAGADALSTAKVLAAAIRREGFDLVITATESTDGYTGVVPQAIAEILQLPAITYVKELRVEGTVLHARRQTEAGYEMIEAELPAVVSVTAGANEPRYPSLKGIMAAKGKPFEQLSLADLGVSGAGVTAAGQEIVSVTAAEERGAGEIIDDDGGAAARIVAFLSDRKVI